MSVNTEFDANTVLEGSWERQEKKLGKVVQRCTIDYSLRKQVYWEPVMGNLPLQSFLCNDGASFTPSNMIL